jgi:hypothetical protein
MFLSRIELKLTYGIDLEIGKAYVDRPVPEENLYWSGRKLYVPPVSGYLFMPIFADLAFRCGIPREQVLSEQAFRLAEDVLHSAMKLEKGMISWEEHVSESIALASAQSRNPLLLEDLKQYFSGKPAPSGFVYGTPFPSLNRADTYLFYLVIFAFDKETLGRLLDAWYAMITYFLIMDDLVDIRSDLEKQEENAFIDAGLNEAGVTRILAMIDDAHDKMLRVNPVMANRIDYKRSTTDVRGIVASFGKTTEDPGVAEV